MAQQLLAATDRASDVPSATAEPETQPEFVLEAPRALHGTSMPLSPGKYGVKVTADEAMHLKLEQLQELLRHRVPNGDFGVIIDLALDLLLAKTKKERFGIKTPSSKASSPATITTASETEFALAPVKAPKRNSRYIPRAVLREVYARDQGQCSFVSAEGRRCTERSFAQPHHDDPFACGGKATVENLMIMCSAHNQFIADQDFGRAHMQSKRTQRSSRRTNCPHRSDQA